ncbi:MAG: argininosuccinate lyase [Saprospiraceae bacterium]|nr:argininosuccinate lyase [Saprospiraceae bacterium]
MKLWEKDIPLNKAVEEFTIGRDPEFDLLLAPFDVIGSMAHAHMLRKIGILSDGEYKALHQSLKQIHRNIESDKFAIEEGVEDVHSQVEQMLTKDLGDIGKKIHTGRSRNDQVLVDLKLFFREEIRKIFQAKSELFDLLLAQADQYEDDLLPGYTHMQAAMPSSFGLWFSAYAENLIDDAHLWSAVLQIVNLNPLGSGAGYGSSLPLDRSDTTELLGFSDLNYNVVHAQMGRGRTELFLSFAIAATASNLSKLAMDVCMYNSQDLAFLTLEDAFTTGSSIMPHKKNPDVFELIRSRCNALTQLPGVVAGMVGHLPSGYHRDLQLTKEYLIPALDQLFNCLQMTHLALSNVQVQKDILDQDKYLAIFSVETVNEMVAKGVPFREAYKKVAADIEQGVLKKPDQLKHTHEGSLGNLCLDEIRAKFERVQKSFDFSYVAKVKELLNKTS